MFVMRLVLKQPVRELVTDFYLPGIVVGERRLLVYTVKVSQKSNFRTSLELLQSIFESISASENQPITIWSYSSFDYAYEYVTLFYVKNSLLITSGQELGLENVTTGKSAIYVRIIHTCVPFSQPIFTRVTDSFVWKLRFNLCFKLLLANTYTGGIPSLKWLHATRQQSS